MIFAHQEYIFKTLLLFLKINCIILEEAKEQAIKYNLLLYVSIYNRTIFL